MQWKSITQSSLVAASVTALGVVAFGVGSPFADEQSGQPAVTDGIQLAQAQSESPAGEPPKAKSTLLMEQTLEGLPGFKVQVVLVEGPPGWVGGRHYHPGHLFGYILEGSYLFNFEDLTAKTVRAGEVFYETPNAIMRSRNGSETEWVRDIVFQVMREGDPPAVSVD